jgi:hypothetical protein
MAVGGRNGGAEAGRLIGATPTGKTCRGLFYVKQFERGLIMPLLMSDAKTAQEFRGDVLKLIAHRKDYASSESLFTKGQNAKARLQARVQELTQLEETIAKIVFI